MSARIAQDRVDAPEACLAFIDAYWEAHWTSPTVATVAEAVGLRSKSTTHAYLQRLVEKGVLERKRVGSRVLYRRVER